jgi:type III restriction enzyme
MLTEGWDANNVTHIFGLRAFGTQLLCEQVVGRALRRRSFDLDKNSLLAPEYADIFGVPFNFADAPQDAVPAPPADVVRVRALPEKSEWEIAFPRVVGYRAALPKEKMRASFNADSRLVLDPELLGATVTENSAIIGEKATMEAAKGFRPDIRPSALAMLLAARCLRTRWGHEERPEHLYGRR